MSFVYIIDSDDLSPGVIAAIIFSVLLLFVVAFAILFVVVRSR